MPTLHIGNDEVARNLLASIMLFPDDNDSREMFLIDKFLFMLVEKWKGSADAPPDEKRMLSAFLGTSLGEYLFMTCGWEKFHSYFSNVQQKQSIVKSAATAMYSGKIAGMVLENILRFDSSVAKSSGVIAAIVKNAPDPAQFELCKGLDEKSIRTRIWSKYNKVAHLWAAYMQFQTDTALTLSCSIDFDSLTPAESLAFGRQLQKGFAGFFDLAVHLQSLGISKRVPRSPTKLLTDDPWILLPK